MSFYATIAGAIKYDAQADFEAAVGILKDDGWLDDEDYLVDEVGSRITEHKPNVDHRKRAIRFPLENYRNLARVLENLFRGGTGKVVWASTDGCFDGGVIVDGKETAYDLQTWNQSKGGDPPPDVDTQLDEFIQWQEQIQEAFFRQLGD